MKNTLIGLLLLASAAAANAEPVVYTGSWVTTNRPLDGALKCVVTELGDNHWRGDFSGEWRGSKFTYSVHFSGPPDNLRGAALIDGAQYQWTGQMSKGPSGSFHGTFGGSRYAGSFSMKSGSK